MNNYFIQAEDDIDLLDMLKGKTMIGMDSEWKPCLKPFTVERIAIFQLSSDTDTFIIDLVALRNSAALDAKLTDIFTDGRTLSIGFSFSSDMSMFDKSVPQMSFYKHFVRFLDI